MTISTTNITKSYSGNGSTHSFAYDFPIFADADLTVIVRSSTGAETTKTLNTHYIVTGAGASSGGNVLFKYNTGTSSDAHYSATDYRPASGETVVIRSELSNTQTLDLVANDPFPASSFETALDRLVRMVQQHDEELNRSIKLSRTNTMTSTEFTNSATDRASKILAFDSSGELSVAQELGTFKGSDATVTTAAYAVRDIIKSTTTAQLNNVYICVAASVVGDALTDTDHFALLVDAVSAATSATTATTQASAAATSLSTFQGQYHGAASSDPSSNLDAGDLYFKTDGTGMKVYNGSAWIDVKPTASEQTNINTVAGSNSEIAALAASAVITDMSMLADTDVIADMALLATTDVIADMNTLATSDIVSDLNTLAASDIVTDLNILATSANVTNMATLGASGVVTNMATLGASGVVTNIATVAGSISNVNTVATNIGTIGTKATVDEATALAIALGQEI